MGTRITSIPTSSVGCDPADASTPAVNTAAVLTYAAVPGQSHHIDGLVWSYAGGTPTGGNLQITDGGSVVFSMDITDQGAGFIPFSRPKRGSVNSALVITLTAGGSGVTGKVSVPNHWTE